MTRPGGGAVSGIKNSLTRGVARLLPPKRRRALLRLAIVASVITLIFLGLTGRLDRFTQANPPGPWAGTPQEAVRGYLEALAAHDAERALSYGATVPLDTTFLTDEQLEKRLGALQVGELSVDQDDLDQDEVEVRTRLTLANGEATSPTLTAVQIGPVWRVKQVATTFTEFDATPVSDDPWYVDDQEVTTGSLTLFPGTHVQSTRSDFLEFETLEVEVGFTDDDDLEQVWPNRWKPTETALNAASDNAAKVLQECLTQRSTAPKGCGFAADTYLYEPVDQKSVKWKLVESDSETPTWSFGTTFLTGQETASAFLDLRLDCTGKYASGEKLETSVWLRAATASFDFEGLQGVHFS